MDGMLAACGCPERRMQNGHVRACAHRLIVLVDQPALRIKHESEVCILYLFVCNGTVSGSLGPSDGAHTAAMRSV